MGKRVKVIDITSADFASYISNMEFNELTDLKNKVDAIFELRCGENEGPNSHEVLDTLVKPARPILVDVFGDGNRTYNIIRKIENKTYNIDKSWPDRHVYDLDNVDRPYLFELFSCSSDDILSVRGISAGFMSKFQDSLDDKGFELGVEFTEDDYKKLFMYAANGGVYKLSIHDEDFTFSSKSRGRARK